MGKLGIIHRGKAAKHERRARKLLGQIARASEAVRTRGRIRAEDQLFLSHGDLRTIYRVGAGVAAHTFLKIAADPERWGPMAAIAAGRELTDRDQGRPAQSVKVEARSYASLLIQASQAPAAADSVTVHALDVRDVPDALGEAPHARESNSLGEYPPASPPLPLPGHARDSKTLSGPGRTPDNAPDSLTTESSEDTATHNSTQTPPRTNRGHGS